MNSNTIPCPSCRKPMRLPFGAYALAPCGECREQRGRGAIAAKCLFENLPEDQKGKPMGLSCPCPKHNPGSW